MKTLQLASPNAHSQKLLKSMVIPKLKTWIIWYLCSKTIPTNIQLCSQQQLCWAMRNSRIAVLAEMTEMAILRIQSSIILIQTREYNECSHSAEPSPQVWLGNKNDYWQENNCRLYLIVYNNNNYTEIINIILIYIYICVCVCYNLHSSPSKST